VTALAARWKPFVIEALIETTAFTLGALALIGLWHVGTWLV